MKKYDDKNVEAWKQMNIAFEADLEEHLDKALNEAAEKLPKWIEVFKRFERRVRNHNVYNEDETYINGYLWDLIKNGENLYFVFADMVEEELKDNDITVKKFENFITGVPTKLTYANWDYDNRYDAEVDVMLDWLFSNVYYDKGF